jgi:hypothetical protein
MAEIGWHADFIEVTFFETYWIRSHLLVVKRRRILGLSGPKRNIGDAQTIHPKRNP